MRRPVLLFLSGIFGVASIAVIAAIFTMPAETISTGSSDALSVATVTRYYAAVNHMIATGDPGPLRAVVSAEMIDQEAPPAGPGGREGIERYVSSLRVAAPDARLEAGPVVADGAEVIAHVSVTRKSMSLPLGLVAERSSVLWPAAEEFIVSGNQIVRRHFRWDGLVFIRPFAHPDATFDFGPTRGLEVTLTHLKSGAQSGTSTGGAPTVVRVMSGRILLAMGRRGPEEAIVLIGSARDSNISSEGIAAGQTRDLAGGEVVLLPPNTDYTIQNAWKEQAFVLRLSVAGPVAADESQFIDQSGEYIVSEQSLLTLPAEGLSVSQLSIGTMTMMAGSHLSVDPSAMMFGFWAEDGVISVTAGALTHGGTQPDPDDCSVSEHHVDFIYLTCPSESMSPLTLLNPGIEPATAWIIVVGPASI